MILTKITKIVSVIALVVLLNACTQTGGESTGSEYMPDMAHSIAYEANYYNYYYNNTWGSEEEYYAYAMPRKPVEGTVARRRTDSESINFPTTGSVPYYFGDTEEERTRAIAELINNPFPITDAGLKEGKELYDTFCGVCHGEKGDGGGYLVRDDGGKYPVQPANFLLDEFVNASNGRYYHSIMYGKNLMGSYTDKISYDERWQVIHYIRSLQAKEKKLAYNQMSNTLNVVDKPAGEIKEVMIGMNDNQSGHDHDGHDHDDHGHDDHKHGGEGHEDLGHDHEGHSHDGHDHDGEGNHDH